jgi:hypothetical protein
MPSVHETAYPRLKSHPSPHELAMVYTPTRGEVALAERVTRSDLARLGFLVLLKAFQRLGYFVQLRGVPPTAVEAEPGIAGGQEGPQGRGATADHHDQPPGRHCRARHPAAL